MTPKEQELRRKLIGVKNEIAREYDKLNQINEKIYSLKIKEQEIFNKVFNCGSELILTGAFVTRDKALKFAKNYMRTH